MEPAIPARATTPETPSPGSERGPCGACRHLRTGPAVTQSTYRVLVDAMKPKAGQAHNQRVLAEAQESANFADQMQHIESLGILEWPRRPIGFPPYCGVAEFDARYLIAEVKNRDLQCTDFSRAEASTAPRSCATCRHNRSPLPRVLMTIEQTIARRPQGRGIRDQHMGPALDAQAVMEYSECVDTAGFMRTRPGMLPVCEALSTEGATTGESRYLVGPVVNFAERCPVWEPGENATNREINLTLDALLAELARTRALSDDPPDELNLAETVSRIDEYHRAAGNDEADVIEYGLSVLGQPNDVVEFIGSSFMAAQWYHPRIRGEAADPHAKPVQVETVQPSPPFAIQPNVVYRHPTYTRVSFEVVGSAEHVFMVVKVGEEVVARYQLNRFPQGQWTQLKPSRGVLPITVLPQLPHAVYVAWY
jgi:hypothetical protein